MNITRLWLLSNVLAISISLYAQPKLPPEIKWMGASERLIVKPGHPWVTYAEQQHFENTPSAHETYEWLNKLAGSSRLISIVEIGKSAAGHSIKMVRVSTDKTFHVSGKSLKPTILFQCGIHAGEIDGKDAGMMLLRDIVHGGKKGLIEKVNFLFIPILNVDGHERCSPFNRINQRGPKNMGWRTNAQNLNLNRDYVKLDTREIRSVMKVLQQYRPELYFDIHVTDGADYQYDITYGFIGDHGYSPAISRWLSTEYRPFVDAELDNNGHVPGTLMFATNDIDFSKGNSDITFPPDYSHSYGSLAHQPTILVENHSLKPYRQRVLGTYILMESSLKLLAEKYQLLRNARQDDLSRRPDSLPLSWKFSKDASDSMMLKGIRTKELTSSITKQQYIQWTGDTITELIPYNKMNQPANFVRLPKAWLVPPAYNEIIDRLKQHGIIMTPLSSEERIAVEMYRINKPVFSAMPTEGHIKVKAGYHSEMCEKVFPAGTFLVRSDQPLGQLAAVLLEPASESSFFQWGFFPGIFSRTEYVEAYIMEPYAQDMLKKSPQLQKELEELIRTNPAIEGNQQALLEWFYKKSPYYDDQYLLYPVGRIR